MSQYPGDPVGGYPIDYSTGAFVPSPRPTSVTVISIFAIILGSLFLLCGGAGVVFQLMVLLSGGRNPFMPGTVGGPAAVIRTDTATTVYGVITGVINLLIAAAMLAIGIGGLKLRPWARRAMVPFALFIICWATLLTIVQIAWIGPRTIAYAQQMQSQMRAPPNPALTGDFAMLMQVIGGIVGWVCWCALPVCALIFWRRPAVVSAFEGSPAQPPDVPSPFGTTWPPPPGPNASPL